MGDEDETRAHRPEAIIEDSLAATLELLRDIPDSPKVRDLRARVETYRRTLGRWPAVKPSKDQRSALRELAIELYERAQELHAFEATTPHQGIPSVKPPDRR
jgi:hypothetical protein